MSSAVSFCELDGSVVALAEAMTDVELALETTDGVSFRTSGLGQPNANTTPKKMNRGTRIEKSV